MKQGATEKKTDNSYFRDKVKLREATMPDKETFYVLDLFSGDATLWRKIASDHPEKHIRLVRIEQRKDAKGVYLRGDNIKFLKRMDQADIERYDVIDLDAYGIPYNQLKILFDKGYKGIIHITFIQSSHGRLNKGMLEELGYTETMVNKIPTLFCTHGMDKFLAYLSLHGVEKVWHITHNAKHYITAILT